MERALNLESQFKKENTHDWKYRIKIIESLLKWGPYDPHLKSLPTIRTSTKLLKRGIIVTTKKQLMHLSQLEGPELTTPLINWMLDQQHKGKIRVHQCAVSIARSSCIPPLKLKRINKRWTVLQTKQAASRDTGSIPIVVKVETITADEFENILSWNNVSPQ